MKRGYSIFGKAYQIMLKNDLHHIKSIDHQFMRQMVLLDEKSRPYLYNTKPVIIDMSRHELFDCSQRFRKNDELKTVTAVLDHTSRAAKTYNVNIKDMVFGGTEKEILERGTNWCADLAREAAVLLDCVSIPCRIVHLVNTYHWQPQHLCSAHQCGYQSENHYVAADRFVERHVAHRRAPCAVEIQPHKFSRYANRRYKKVAAPSGLYV